jgi:hypothetical protein
MEKETEEIPSQIVDPIEEARKIIEDDKARRVQQFKVELDALMQKYNCTIEHGQILLIAK